MPLTLALVILAPLGFVAGPLTGVVLLALLVAWCALRSHSRDGSRAQRREAQAARKHARGMREAEAARQARQHGYEQPPAALPGGCRPPTEPWRRARSPLGRC